jgi:hypothetical protein
MQASSKCKEAVRDRSRVEKEIKELEKYINQETACVSCHALVCERCSGIVPVAQTEFISDRR